MSHTRRYVKNGKSQKKTFLGINLVGPKDLNSMKQFQMSVWTCVFHIKMFELFENSQSLNENVLMYFLIYPATLDGKSFNNSSDYIKMPCCAKSLLISLWILAWKWMLYSRRSFWIMEQQLQMSVVNSQQIPHYQ